jgi:hypothetical protein
MWRAAAFATAGEVSGSTTASHSRRDLSLVRPTCRGADRIEYAAKIIFRRDDFSKFVKRKNPRMKVRRSSQQIATRMT